MTRGPRGTILRAGATQQPLANQRRHDFRVCPVGDSHDLRHLLDSAVQQANGLTVEPLTVREARKREALLSPAIACALDTPADHQVDPRLLVDCLRRSLAEPGSGNGTGSRWSEPGWPNGTGASRRWSWRTR